MLERPSFLQQLKNFGQSRNWVNLMKMRWWEIPYTRYVNQYYCVHTPVNQWSKKFSNIHCLLSHSMFCIFLHSVKAILLKQSWFTTFFQDSQGWIHAIQSKSFTLDIQFIHTGREPKPLLVCQFDLIWWTGSSGQMSKPITLLYQWISKIQY